MYMYIYIYIIAHGGIIIYHTIRLEVFQQHGNMCSLLVLLGLGLVGLLAFNYENMVASCRSSTLQQQQQQKHHKQQSGGGDNSNGNGNNGDNRGMNDMYPLKTFFIYTSSREAIALSQTLPRKGKYHNYINIIQYRSHYCFGWHVKLKVVVDDTSFFNAGTVCLNAQNWSG